MNHPQILNIKNDICYCPTITIFKFDCKPDKNNNLLPDAKRFFQIVHAVKLLITVVQINIWIPI